MSGEKKDIAIIDHGKCETTEGPEIKVGDWFWVPKGVPADDPSNERWLGNVVHIGSNYVKIESPRSKNNGYSHVRIHFDNLEDIEYEPNAESYIQGQVNYYQEESQRVLSEIQRVTASLGMNPDKKQIDGPVSDNALMVISGGMDVDLYKTSLIKAKEDILPTLFKEMKEANEEMTYWLSAPTVPFMAQSEGLNRHIKKIDERIFNVSLYAGLVEEIKLCHDGKPAEATEKLHVMQRRLWMDEESLLDYDIGGMEFKDIGGFDEWLCRPHNMNRILPFPRTVVAMQVRRKTKDRTLYDEEPLDMFVRFSLEKADKATFLYIRNGEKVYRLTCDGLDFGEMIFPNKGAYDPSEEMMFECGFSRVGKFMPKREYDFILAEIKEQKKLHEDWKSKNPDEQSWNSPYRKHDTFRDGDWHRFSPSSVYYDDAVEISGDEFKKYNRIAMLLQGLFDRSEALHPHPPVKLWNPDGFSAAIKLVYDAQTLYPSEKAPDFKEYRKCCNASIKVGSMVIGQRLFWKKREAEKENERRENDYRRGSRDYTPWTVYEPYGNPGPDKLATIEKWQPRVKKAVFSWHRERVRYDYYDDSTIRCTLTVPDGNLFNIDAYKPGDYKQFFSDPRTRANYMKWAPMLLAAEEYHARKEEKE